MDSWVKAQLGGDGSDNDGKGIEEGERREICGQLERDGGRSR